MKYLSYIFVLLGIIVFNSCDKEEDSATRATDKIEVFIDGSTTPLTYSSNIVAKDYPLPPTSGFSCLFKITSEDSSGTNMFTLNLGQTVDSCPFTMVTPVYENLYGPAISKLNIEGLDINYTDSRNAITINYNIFGTISGDDLDIDFNGKYYDSTGQMHPIVGYVNVERN